MNIPAFPAVAGAATGVGAMLRGGGAVGRFGQGMDSASPQVVVIGGGRIGTALVQQSQARGVAVALVTRDAGWQALDAAAGTPIALCVRNDDLDAVLARLPPHRRGDLAFLQNGMLRPWLAAQGFDNPTRGLLFFAVGRRGDPPAPGGTSPFVGPHAAALARWLGDLGLAAEAVDAPAFAAIEVEKLLWNCAFGLMCQAHGCSVGAVVRDHGAQLRALCAELLQLAAPACGVDLAFAPLFERLCAYSLAIADYRGAVKEWPWRNGWFVAEAAARQRDCPEHARLLQRIGR